MASEADAGLYLRATVKYEDRRGDNKMASAALTTPIGEERPAVNSAPFFSESSETEPVTRTVAQGTASGRRVGAPIRAADPDTEEFLHYALGGTDADQFDIDPDTGQILTKAVLDYNAEGQNSYSVIVQVDDGFSDSYTPSSSPDDSIEVTIQVTEISTRTTNTGGGGGGGGPPPVPIPSDEDFDWNVTRDIEALDGGQRPADRDLVRRDHALGRGERGDRSRPGLCLQPAHG